MLDPTRRRARCLLLLAGALALLAAWLPGARAFGGGLGGFGSLGELSELPEDVFEDEPSITGKDILAGASKPSSNNNNKGKASASASVTAAVSPTSGGIGISISGNPKAAAAWRAVRATTAKAFLPSLATAAAGAAATTLQRRYGQRVVRLLSEQRERARLRREKGRLEREIRREEQRYEREMRGMMEEATQAQHSDGDESVEQEEEEEEREREREQAQEQQQQQRRPPGVDMRAYMEQLEDKVQSLKGEVARVNAAKQDELGSARAVVEQLRRELEGARHSRGQLQEQLEAVKREYHQRVAVLKEQAQQAAQEAVAGQVPEDERRRIRAEAQAAAQGEAERAVAEARETVEKEARHGALVELRAQVQRERAKYEGEIVEMYRRRLKEEVGKRDALLEDRLRAQDAEYRRQCEELRVKVQQLLRDRDQQMRAKVASHAREWQEKAAAGAGKAAAAAAAAKTFRRGPRPQQQQAAQQQQQQQPPRGYPLHQQQQQPEQEHQGGGAWEQQQHPQQQMAPEEAYRPQQLPQQQPPQQQPQQRPARRGAAAVGRGGRYPAPSMNRRERV